MAYDLIVANGTVVNATESIAADVAIEGDTIVAIAPGLVRAGARRVIDAAGKYVLPGGVDVHTHLDMPLGNIRSADDFFTGTRAAAFGGTTTIIDFANQSRGESLHAAVEQWHARAAAQAVIDYGFHCTISDFSERTLEEMDDLVREGITSFKVFTAYPGRLMLDDASIFRVLQRSAHNGALVCVHAENGPIIDVLVAQAIAAGNVAPHYHASTRPARAEAEAVNRVIEMAAIAGAPLYVVHVSCAESVERIKAAQSRCERVLAETCPQYLFLTEENLEQPDCEGARYVFTPPPRTHCDQEQLWTSLANGTLAAVSTDHCPFNYAEKAAGARIDFTRIPNGVPGIEHRLALLYTGGVAAGRFNMNRFVELVSTAPARIFGLYPRKGVLAPQSDADLVVFNPHAEQTLSARTHHMHVDYSAYEGMQIRGTCDLVISRGRLIVEETKFHACAGQGEFLRRKSFNQSMSRQDERV